MAIPDYEDSGRLRRDLVVLQTIFFDPGDGMDPIPVKFNRGSIQCQCGLSEWCDHAAAILKSNEDTLPDHLEKMVVSVPLVPTLGLWVDVDAVRGARGSLSITLTDDASMSGEHAVLKPFLGVIGPYESRNVIRTMVVDWFDSVVHASLDVKKCPATGGHHGWKQQRGLEAGLRENNPGWMFANRWALWWFGECLPCMTREASGYDDLVPGEATPRFGWGGNGSLVNL